VESFGTPKECFCAHHNFVVAGDVTGVLNTFAEDCVISFFNTATYTRVETKGPKEASKLYTGFLKLIDSKEVAIVKGSEGGNNFNGDTACFAYKSKVPGSPKPMMSFVSVDLLKIRSRIFGLATLALPLTCEFTQDLQSVLMVSLANPTSVTGHPSHCD